MNIDKLHEEFIDRYKEWEAANAMCLGYDMLEHIWEIYTEARDKYFHAIAMRAN